MRNSALVQEARDLRARGWSISKIATKLKTKSSTISRWSSNTEILSQNRTYIHYFNLRKSFLAMDEINVNLDSQSAKLWAAMLYWCEGAKYPSSNVVNFTGSDAEMVSFFLKLLRIAFPIQESKLRVHLQLHTDQNIEEINSFWSQLLKIPKNQFHKPTITTKTGGRYRRSYQGTCSLRYNDYSIQLRLMGIYQRLFRSFSSGSLRAATDLMV